MLVHPAGRASSGCLRGEGAGHCWDSGQGDGGPLSTHTAYWLDWWFMVSARAAEMITAGTRINLLQTVGKVLSRPTTHSLL